MSATLVVSILTGTIFSAFRTSIPELSFISTDFGKTSEGFAQPAKWGQEVVSQMAQSPTATDHTPGDDLSVGATNVKDLVTDVKVVINRAKKVVLKLPTVDAVSLQLDSVFMTALKEAGKSLGRAVVGDVVALANSQNFSQETVQTIAGADYDVLGESRIGLNLQGAGAPRYMLGGSRFIGNIAKDPIVSGGDYHGQKTEADPYIELTNIEGFNSVREFPNMPNNTVEIGVVVATAATDILTLAAHGLPNGQRVRFTTTTTLPAGLLPDKDYYVRDTAANTFKVAGTPSGAAINITDTGTGAHTVHKFEELNAIAFEKRAFHVGFRKLDDNQKMAAALGIPKTFLELSETDPESGLTVTIFLWQDQKTHDIFAAVVVAYGAKAGRALTGADVPATEAEGSGFDYAGLRIVEEATDNAA